MYLDNKKLLPVSESANFNFLDFSDKKQFKASKIVYVGDMSKYREPKFILEVFSIVLDECKNVDLLFIGGSKSEISLLKELSIKIGLRDKVNFAGFQPYKKIPELLFECDIGVSSIPPIDIYFDSTPTKLMEYMAMGMPVVANEEINDHKKVLERSGGGQLVTYTPKSFASAIIWLLKNPDMAKTIGNNGKRWIRQNRTYRHVSKIIEAKYLEIL